MKRGFLSAVGVAVIVTLFFGFYLWRSSRSDGIAIFNLWVDIVVGIFTIWGLYWAATEFAESARKPDLRLLVGRPIEPSAPVRLQQEFTFPPSPLLHIPGWYERPSEPVEPPPRPRVVCGLCLENRSSRAGRYIRVVIRTSATPAPIRCRSELHRSYLRPAQSESEDPKTGQPSTSVQLEESLVVYQSPVLIGALVVEWDSELPKDEFPESIVLDYDIYTLDGASNGEIKLHIEWNEG